MFEKPPRKKSPPVAEAGLTVSCGRISAGENDAPPSVDSYRPTCAAPGGVKRPPFTEDEPCRATSVPMKMWFGFAGSTAIAPMERPVATGQVPLPEAHGAVDAVLPGTSVQLLPKSVDLYRPRPASESPEPFGSPVPTYRVLPFESFGSKTIEPIAFDGRPMLDECQFGCEARPLSASHTPPPAAPMKTLQSLAWHAGDTAIAVA